MIYIISQDGMRISELHGMSIVSPENDRYEEDVYKVYVNGSEFARYKEKKDATLVMEMVKYSMSRAKNEVDYLQLPEEE